MLLFRACGVLLVSVLLVIGGVSGCATQPDAPSPPIPKAHPDYIASFHWHIEKPLESTVYPKGYFRGERLGQIKAAGADLTPYVNEEIKETGYVLQEREQYGKIYFFLYEVNNKIVAAHLGYEGYTPGLVSLKANTP